jgi:hypothetical protein
MGACGGDKCQEELNTTSTTSYSKSSTATMDDPNCKTTTTASKLTNTITTDNESNIRNITTSAENFVWMIPPLRSSSTEEIPLIVEQDSTCCTDSGTIKVVSTASTDSQSSSATTNMTEMGKAIQEEVLEKTSSPLSCYYASDNNNNKNKECFRKRTVFSSTATTTKIPSSSSSSYATAAAPNNTNKTSSSKGATGSTFRDLHQDRLRKQTSPIIAGAAAEVSSLMVPSNTSTTGGSRCSPTGTSSSGTTTTTSTRRRSGITRLVPVPVVPTSRYIPSTIRNRLVVLPAATFSPSSSTSTTSSTSLEFSNTNTIFPNSTNVDTSINNWNNSPSTQQQQQQQQQQLQGQHHNHHLRGESSTFMSSSSWTIVSTETRASGEGSPPCPRSLHSAAVIGDDMYIFGGYDGSSRLNDFYSFSFREMIWSPITSSSSSSSPPSPRDRHVSVAHNHTFYVFGGFDGRSRVNDLYGYNTLTHQWQCIDAGTTTSSTYNHISPNANNSNINSSSSGTPPSPRHSHSAAVYENSMYVFGGYDGSYRSDVTQFHFLDKCWRTLPTVGRSPRPRYRATCVTVPSRHIMIVFGGHDGTRHLADTHTLDLITNMWNVLLTTSDAPPSSSLLLPLPRDSHIAVLVEPHDSILPYSSPYSESLATPTTMAIMYVFGGSTGSAMNDLFRLTMEFHDEVSLDAATATSSDNTTTVIRNAHWSQIIYPEDSSSIPNNRFCHVGVCYRDSLYVFGGYDGNNRLNDFLCYDFFDETSTIRTAGGNDSYLTGSTTKAAAATNPYNTDFQTLPDYLYNFLNHNELSDVTFIVEDVPVFAHKLLLVRSSYFRAMFLGPMPSAATAATAAGEEQPQELRFKEATQKEITLDHVRLPIFLHVLTFLYTDRCDALLIPSSIRNNNAKVPPNTTTTTATTTLLSLEDTIDLFIAADEFCVPRLKLLCEKKIISSLNIENAASIFLAADLFAAEELKRKTLKFILNHFEQVSKTVTFEEMARSNVDLVLEILRKRS